MLHSSENCFGDSSNQQSIKDGLGGALGNRADSVNQYKNSEHKRKKDLKDLKKKNEILYSIDKKSVSCSELKNIKNIKDKASKKHSNSSSNSSRD